jgi:Co/Zn/Cd efflux system component
MDLISQSTYKITKMDCPSEEQMIRMKLEGVEDIKGLSFDIPNRKLDVIHIGDRTLFEHLIQELNLDTQFVESSQINEFKEEKENSKQRKMLWWVLAINFTFFIIEMLYGWLSSSLGLVADSLDMLADSFVYGLSLMAVGKEITRKKKVAKLSGYFQIFLALFGLIEVIRRFVTEHERPIFQNMVLISILALVANYISLLLIQKSKSQDAHMQASMIFTSNDIIINIGVIIAGVLVYFTASKYPDLIIGGIIFLIVVRGALRILKLSK